MGWTLFLDSPSLQGDKFAPGCSMISWSPVCQDSRGRGCLFPHSWSEVLVEHVALPGLLRGPGGGGEVYLTWITESEQNCCDIGKEKWVAQGQLGWGRVSEGKEILHSFWQFDWGGLEAGHQGCHLGSSGFLFLVCKARSLGS